MIPRAGRLVVTTDAARPRDEPGDSHRAAGRPRGGDRQRFRVQQARGCDVTLAGIEFTDPHYARKFGRFPFRHALRDLLTVLPAQTRRATGQIRIPDAAREGDYDLVCFGSPTWFFTTNMPLRSYLKSAEAGKVLAGKRFAAYVVCRRYWSINLKEVRKLATAQGGTYTDSTRFQFAGGQIRSLLSLLS
jgi:hypothetical protein